MIQIQFRYYFTFQQAGGRIPDRSEVNEAPVIIDGECEGQRIQIRGDGYFGRACPQSCRDLGF